MALEQQAHGNCFFASLRALRGVVWQCEEDCSSDMKRIRDLDVLVEG